MMKYTVWLLARPLSVEAFLAPLSGSSDGRDHFRHWGVLVSEMTLVDAQAIFTRTRGFWDNNDIELGTLYETFPDDQGFQNVWSRHGPLQMATIRNEWRALSFQLVGETDMTHEMIQQEGMQAPSLQIVCFVIDLPSNPNHTVASEFPSFREQLPELCQIPSRSSVSRDNSMCH